MLSRHLNALLIIIALLACSDALHAQCLRGDIDYYLEKGFTTEQITTICANQDQPASTPKNLSNDSNTNVKATPISSVPNNKPNHSTNDFKEDGLLSRSIDATNIYLTPAELHFTQQVCLEFGRPTPNGKKKKFCPVFDYQVAREGLTLVKIERPSVFSKKKLMLIKGNISIRLNADKEYKHLKERLIQAYMENNETLEIPIKANAPEKLLRERLLEISLIEN